MIDQTLTKQLEYIEKSIAGTRFTSVTEYLEEQIELLRTRMVNLEGPYCQGSLLERTKEHKSLQVLSRSYLVLLMEHYKIYYRGMPK